MESMNYKDHTIKAQPEKLQDGKWQLKIKIIEHRGHETITRLCSSSTSFHSQEEAIPHCFEFGRRVIDGDIVI